MQHSSIAQLKVLIGSLEDVSLNANGRIEILQRIRQTAASLHLNGLHNPMGNSEQIDAMVLEAVESALRPFEQEPLGHSNTGTFPAAEYSQP